MIRFEIFCGTCGAECDSEFEKLENTNLLHITCPSCAETLGKQEAQIQSLLNNKNN